MAPIRMPGNAAWGGHVKFTSTSNKLGHIADEGNISSRLKSHWTGILNLCSSSLIQRLQVIKTYQRTQLSRSINSRSGLRFDTQIHTPLNSRHNFHTFMSKWFTCLMATQQLRAATACTSNYTLRQMYRSYDLQNCFLRGKSRVRISEPVATYPARYSSTTFFWSFDDLQRWCHPSCDDPTLPHPFHFIIHYDPVIQYYITWYEIVAK
jgi:hypothetical protein